MKILFIVILILFFDQLYWSIPIINNQIWLKNPSMDTKDGQKNEVDKKQRNSGFFQSTLVTQINAAPQRSDWYRRLNGHWHLLIGRHQVNISQVSYTRWGCFWTLITTRLPNHRYFAGTRWLGIIWIVRGWRKLTPIHRSQEFVNLQRDKSLNPWINKSMNQWVN